MNRRQFFGAFAAAAVATPAVAESNNSRTAQEAAHREARVTWWQVRFRVHTAEYDRQGGKILAGSNERHMALVCVAPDEHGEFPFREFNKVLAMAFGHKPEVWTERSVDFDEDALLLIDPPGRSFSAITTSRLKLFRQASLIVSMPATGDTIPIYKNTLGPTRPITRIRCT